jgi:hypothetical protein
MYARPSLNDHFSGNDFTNILPPKFITFHPETGNECDLKSFLYTNKLCYNYGSAEDFDGDLEHYFFLDENHNFNYKGPWSNDEYDADKKVEIFIKMQHEANKLITYSPCTIDYCDETEHEQDDFKCVNDNYESSEESEEESSEEEEEPPRKRAKKNET